MELHGLIFGGLLVILELELGFWIGEANHKSHAMTSSDFFYKKVYLRSFSSDTCHEESSE